VKKGQEIKVSFDDLVIYHQNLPKKQVKPHSHKEAHVFMPLKGDIWITLGEQRVRVTPGKMLVLAGGQKHSFESSKEQGERIVAMVPLAIKETALLPCHHLLRELFFFLLSDKDSPLAKKTTGLIKGLLKEITAEQPFGVHNLHSKAEDERVLRAIELMDKELDASISQIAKEVGTSGKTLTRLFQMELELTPKQVQTAFRIDRASTLLRKGGYSVTDAAFEVGFNSLSSFIKAYRNHTGKVPSTDRR
tara:strand:- start:320205 stop:320948 length:744 start_codon:yes stop_codon:yes gene_type:complete